VRLNGCFEAPDQRRGRTLSSRAPAHHHHTSPPAPTIVRCHAALIGRKKSAKCHLRLAPEMLRLEVATPADLAINTLAQRLCNEIIANGSVIVTRAEICTWSRVCRECLSVAQAERACSLRCFQATEARALCGDRLLSAGRLGDSASVVVLSQPAESGAPGQSTRYANVTTIH
jgi:hypothetical protein